MTKRFFLIAAVALLFTACAKDEVDVVTPIQKQGSGQLTIGASFENNATKSDIDDNGNFTWSTEDGIKDAYLPAHRQQPLLPAPRKTP